MRTFMGKSEAALSAHFLCEIARTETGIQKYLIPFEGNCPPDPYILNYIHGVGIAGQATDASIGG